MSPGHLEYKFVIRNTPPILFFLFWTFRINLMFSVLAKALNLIGPMQFLLNCLS
jgi:hypothetical protein